MTDIPDQFHGGSVIADLMGDDAEQVVGVGMVRIEPEHPPVGGLGVRQLPGLVRPQPVLKKGLEIGGRRRAAALLVFCRLFRLFLLAASLCLVHPIGDLKRKSVSK